MLVRIDPRDYQARVDQAQAAWSLPRRRRAPPAWASRYPGKSPHSGTSGADAQLATAQANYDKTKFSYEKDSTTELAYARARVATQQANNERAQADLARMKPSDGES